MNDLPKSSTRKLRRHSCGSCSAHRYPSAFRASPSFLFEVLGGGAPTILVQFCVPRLSTDAQKSSCMTASNASQALSLSPLQRRSLK